MPLALMPLLSGNPDARLHFPPSMTAVRRKHDRAERIRTVSFVSLGCPKNLVDSEKMLGLLAESGLSPVAQEGDRVAPADAIVINTCGFLEASKEESLEVIRDAIRMKQAGEVKRVVVAGCLVQRHRETILEWAPGVDAMIGVFDRDHVVEAVRGGRRESLAGGPRYWITTNALHAAKERGVRIAGLTVNGKDGRGLGYYEDDSARLRLTPRHYAYLRISEGCNQNCAFCTIPSIRGKMRSKPIDRILAEARELIADGAFELNLIGQDTTSYGEDIGIGFNHDGRGGGGLPMLLRTLNDEIERLTFQEAAPESSKARIASARPRASLRLMYAYPSTFNDAMIDAISQLPNVVKYIDIPLQHASDRMLSAMRRRVSASAQRDLIHRLRERVPGIAVRTTFITGFPGETERDHQELLAFAEEMRFDAMGVFAYSREDRTPAGTMDLDPALHVPAEVKARRRDELMRAQQRIAFERAASRIGERHDVLIDRVLPHAAVGRCAFQAPEIDSATFVESRRPLAPGDFVPCTITGSRGYDLVARPDAEPTGWSTPAA